MITIHTDKSPDLEYMYLVNDVLTNGYQKDDRTGTGTISVFGKEMFFDISNGKLPILTTKKIHLPSIVHELLWMISGSTNVKYLQDNGVRIWNEWADKDGELGPIYGAQWRKIPKHNVNNNKQEYVDQLQDCIDTIINNPNSRRILVNAWNPSQLDDMNLPPCHFAFQFWTRPLSLDERNNIFEDQVKRDKIIPSDCNIQKRSKYLDEHNIPLYALHCKMYQRSCDVGLGVPFNIVQYSLLTHMIAQVTNTVAERFIWSGGDVHIYQNHIDALKEQISRHPYDSTAKVVLNDEVTKIDDFKYDDINIINYQSHPTIKMKVSI